MAPPPDSPSINIKVSWLKQNLAAGTSQPVLEFDEQQLFHFDPHQTTFRMVKHSCSYPAPPHKVRMWCSSFGAATELPLSMELNVFINTFELITEEKHTLAMVRLRRLRRPRHRRQPDVIRGSLWRTCPCEDSPAVRPQPPRFLYHNASQTVTLLKP